MTPTTDTLAANHDQLGAVIALIVALLLCLPYLAVKAILWFEGWQDRRYAAETPAVAAWERHCRTTPGLLDLRDEEAWEHELRTPPATATGTLRGQR